jgi:Domain of unknown function (DUF3291)
MALVSVTRLRLRSVRFILPFAWYTARSALQAKRSPGNRGVNLRKTNGLAFWTLTVWENGQAMRAFRGAVPHGKAMRKLPYWCDEASYAHWEDGTGDLPSWEDAAKRLSHTGKLSKVHYPSADHKAGRIVTT